ncbi:hypothetical protein DPMN_062526 [Dreissena polymorpha]|uniref:Uncharacterized protein n=1 Tax=Dreissena polymorpha TaxID=45954 RepID=A0A9D4HI80_DREPO|nr:hypothetical protein DPMN_062526 [Dreissena polymorpha]
MREKDFQEWRKLISADHIEMGTKYIRRLSKALHLAFFIVFLQKYHADKKEEEITDVLDSKNIDAHWMSFTSFPEEGSRRNGTFALHRDIMTHCDEVCAIAFAERLGGPQGYNLLLAALKSSLPFSFQNGESSYAAFPTKLLHEYYKSGIYYQNMKHSLFSTPIRGSKVNCLFDIQREMDHKDALKAFRSGSTVASVLPRMSLIDVLDDIHERTAHSKMEKTQDEKYEKEL